MQNAHVTFLESLLISVYAMSLVFGVLVGLSFIVKLMAYALGANNK